MNILESVIQNLKKAKESGEEISKLLKSVGMSVTALEDMSGGINIGKQAEESEERDSLKESANSDCEDSEEEIKSETSQFKYKKHLFHKKTEMAHRRSSEHQESIFQSEIGSNAESQALSAGKFKVCTKLDPHSQTLEIFLVPASPVKPIHDSSVPDAQRPIRDSEDKAFAEARGRASSVGRYPSSDPYHGASYSGGRLPRGSGGAATDYGLASHRRCDSYGGCPGSYGGVVAHSWRHPSYHTHTYRSPGLARISDFRYAREEYSRLRSAGLGGFWN